MKTIKHGLRHTFVAAAVGGLVATASAQAEELNALLWCDHSDPAVTNPFEQRTGIQVNVKEFDGTGSLIAILEQSLPGDWDVINPDLRGATYLMAQGIYAPLDATELPWDGVWDGINHPERYSHEGQMYIFPEKFGYATQAVNKNTVPESDWGRISTWWDEGYSGKVAVYDDYSLIISLLAMDMGIDPDNLSVDDLPGIRDRLFEIKDNGAVIADVVTGTTMLSTGDVDILAGGGEYAVTVLHEEYPQLDWVVPDVGGIRWIQTLGIHRDSMKKDLSLQFINYMLEPSTQALLATSACYWGIPAIEETGRELNDTQRGLLRWDRQQAYLSETRYARIEGRDQGIDQAMIDLWSEFLAR